MMTQNVKTQAVNLFSDSKTTKSSAVKQKGTDNDFSSVMDSNLKSKSTTQKGSEAVKESSNAGNKDSKVTDKTKASKAVTKDGNATRANGSPATDSPDKNPAVTDESQVDDIQDVTQDLSKRVQDFLAILKNTVQSSLGITQEELEKAMETLGLTMVDLCSPENLKQLVLQLNGADITAVLTDENLANTVNQLINAVDDLKSGQNLPVSQEELAEIINRLQNGELNETQPEQSLQPAANTVPDVPEQDLTGADDAPETKQNDITVEIHKFQDTEADGNDSLTNESGKREANVETASPADMFIQNLAVKGNENTMNFTEQIANVRQMQEITNQIVEQIKIMIKPDQTSMELQLNPESLGKINLSVVAKDGIMTAHFTTQNELAKEAIESQMQVLKDNLNNQGLKVESIEVTVSNFTFDQSSQASGGEGKGQQSNTRNRNTDPVEAESYPDSNEKEAGDMELMNQSGNSIDYTA